MSRQLPTRPRCPICDKPGFSVSRQITGKGGGFKPIPEVRECRECKHIFRADHDNGPPTSTGTVKK